MIPSLVLGQRTALASFGDTIPSVSGLAPVMVRRVFAILNRWLIIFVTENIKINKSINVKKKNSINGLIFDLVFLDQSDGGSVRSYGEESPEEAVKVTRSIMIIKPPGYQGGSAPVSPAGSTPPVSPFSGEFYYISYHFVLFKKKKLPFCFQQ